MIASLSWVGGDDASPTPFASHAPRDPKGRPLLLPHAVESAIWRGDALGSPVTRVLSSGFEALDAELPGGGWPCGSLTEVLQVQATVLEWRLFAPAVRALVLQGKQIVVVGPPKAPHIPGLVHLGLDERHLVWIHADKPVERLWAIEQLLRANAAGMVLGWVPQARQEQIRRLLAERIAAADAAHLVPVRQRSGRRALHPGSAGGCGLGPHQERRLRVR